MEPAQRGAGACDLALLALTSNLVFSDWERIFKDPMATAADRSERSVLIQSADSETNELQGQTMRASLCIPEDDPRLKGN